VHYTRGALAGGIFLRQRKKKFLQPMRSRCIDPEKISGFTVTLAYTLNNFFGTIGGMIVGMMT
jgi:hypothetical protein